jgi:hypothetical protein
LPLSAALAGATLTQGNAQALPAALVNSTGKAAALLAAGKTAGGGVSPEVAALVEGMSNALLRTKIRMAALLLLAVAVIAGGATALTGREAGTQPARTQPEPPESPAANEDVSKPAPGPAMRP